MNKNTLLNLILLFFIMVSFLLGFQIRKYYRKTLIIPGHISHAGDHDLQGTGEGGQLQQKDLDFMHVKILNHPWNNPGIIGGLFLHGLLYLLMAGILYVKLFRLKNE